MLYPRYIYRHSQSTGDDTYFDLSQRMDNIILLHIDFDDMTYPSFEMVERITIIDAVGFVGGTIGIFTGFSVLSIIEIFSYIHKNLIR